MLQQITLAVRLLTTWMVAPSGCLAGLHCQCK